MRYNNIWMHPIESKEGKKTKLKSVVHFMQFRISWKHGYQMASPFRSQNYHRWREIYVNTAWTLVELFSKPTSVYIMLAKHSLCSLNSYEPITCFKTWKYTNPTFLCIPFSKKLTNKQKHLTWVTLKAWLTCRTPGFIHYCLIWIHTQWMTHIQYCNCSCATKKIHLGKDHFITKPHFP